MPLYKFSKAEGRLYLESREEPVERMQTYRSEMHRTARDQQSQSFGEETVTRRSVISRRTTTMSSTQGSTSSRDYLHKATTHTDHLPLTYSSSHENSYNSYKRAKVYFFFLFNIFGLALL